MAAHALANRINQFNYVWRMMNMVAAAARNAERRVCRQLLEGSPAPDAGVLKQHLDPAKDYGHPSLLQPESLRSLDQSADLNLLLRDLPPAQRLKAIEAVCAGICQCCGELIPANRFACPCIDNMPL